jgi:hypothetical protein
VLHQSGQLGVRVVVVAFAGPESLAGYQHRQGLDHLLVLSDPDRRAYETFGLGRGSVLRVWLDPRVWMRYLQLVLRGRRPELAHDDTLQLGGDALIAADGRITWIYRSRGPEDRPTLAHIRREVTQLRTGAGAS